MKNISAVLGFGYVSKRLEGDYSADQIREVQNVLTDTAFNFLIVPAGNGMLFYCLVQMGVLPETTVLKAGECCALVGSKVGPGSSPPSAEDVWSFARSFDGLDAKTQKVLRSIFPHLMGSPPAWFFLTRG